MLVNDAPKVKSPAAGHSYVAFSPDGVNWTVDYQARWCMSVPDGGLNIIYNPYTKKYQFTQRSCWTVMWWTT